MSKQRQALELALEALEKHGNSYLNHEDEYSAAKDAIREALAEPEQKPIAVVTSQTGDPITMSWHHEPALPIGTKLYAAPPARKPLADKEIKDCEKQSMVNGSLPFEQRLLFARAIEKAHGIGE